MMGQQREENNKRKTVLEQIMGKGKELVEEKEERKNKQNKRKNKGGKNTADGGQPKRAKHR
jgi:hypothetical protein